MKRLLISLFGATVAVGLVVLALWAWFRAGALAHYSTASDVTPWAIRALAIASASGAQVILLSFVGSSAYRDRPLHDGLRLTAALVCCISAVTAAALGLAARG